MTRNARWQRRTPEQARTEILDGAERVFAERNPDAVGLKEVAQAAGVSHALIVHYFKTYQNLVEEVLRRRTQRIGDEIRDRVRKAGPEPGPTELLAMLFQTLSHPAHARLIAWASTRQLLAPELGRPQGLQLLARYLEATGPERAERTGQTPPSRDRLEASILVGVAAAHGYALAQRYFLAGLDWVPGPEAESRFLAALSEMLERFLREPPIDEAQKLK